MKTIFSKIREEGGAVQIVEAAFVFPIVLFVLLFLMFLGNFFYQQAKVDSITMRGAEYLASRYTRPLLSETSIPTKATDMTEPRIRPYRYLLGDGGSAEGKTLQYVNGLLKKTGSGYFSGMEIRVNGSPEVKIHNYVLYQTATIEIHYSIRMMPMLFFDGPEIYKVSCATATAALDGAEFIRNVDMIMDYTEQWELLDKVKAFFG